MRQKTTYAIALSIFVIDQIVKWLMIGPLQLESIRQITILPIFSFTWVENRGISLGMLQASSDAMRWGLVAATAGIAAGVAWWLTRESQKGDQIGLAMVLGGALGNIVDRVRFGYVVDFLDLHFGEWRPFYVFNIADAAISIGVVILLFRAFFVKSPKEKADHA